MEDKLNIAEILEDAPTGTLLYSPIFGELAYIGCYAHVGQTYSIIVCQYPDAIGQGDSVSVEFDENGTYLNRGYSSRRGGECMLFPSKENRDWSTFKVPKTYKHFEPFQKILVAVDYLNGDNFSNFDGKKWCADLYSHYDEKSHMHYLVGYGGMTDEEIIAYEGNEDKLGKLVEIK